MYGGSRPVGSGGICAALALALVIVIYRSGGSGPGRILGDTVRESTMILMIIAAAAVFSYMLSLLYVTQTAAQALVDLQMNRWMLMLAINLFLLVAGCFLPPVAIILMRCHPAAGAGSEPVRHDLVRRHPDDQHGGRADHPARGAEPLRAEGRRSRRPLTTVLRGSMPFVLIMLATMVLLCVFPQIATWLPDRMMGAQ